MLAKTCDCYIINLNLKIEACIKLTDVIVFGFPSGKFRTSVRNGFKKKYSKRNIQGKKEEIKKMLTVMSTVTEEEIIIRRCRNIQFLLSHLSLH